jgi:hypothetical protein
MTKVFVTVQEKAKDVFGIDWGIWLTDNFEHAKRYGLPTFATELSDDIRLRRFASRNEFEAARDAYESDLDFVKAVLEQGYQGVIFYQAPWVSGQEIGIFDADLIESLQFDLIV